MDFSDSPARRTSNVAACDPELPPLEMISGTKSAITTAARDLFRNLAIAVAVSNSPRNNSTSHECACGP